jgi:hypothetical protein
MTTPPRHLAAATLVAATLAAATLSCGASIRGLYESDVRFEHCMALDSRPDVKPTLRRACWDEWVSFYTFGQPRDRTDYARLREKQLSSASDFDEGDVAPPRLAAAAPDPTSAIAPPPMMMAVADDGGAPDAGAPTEADERTATHDRCAAECQSGLEACRMICKATGPCERACTGRLARCNVRCEHPTGGRAVGSAGGQGSR